MGSTTTTTAARPRAGTQDGTCSAGCGGGPSTGHRACALLLDVGRGDHDAFATLYDELAPMVFSVVLRVVHSREIAEEVTQDVFLWLWREAPRFDPKRGSASALVRTVARRRAVDAVRREATARRKLGEVEPSPEVAQDPTSRVDDRDLVQSLMTGLTEVQRRAVGLAYGQGLTGRELAAQLGTGVATAKTRKRDGLVRMRAAVDPSLL